MQYILRNEVTLEVKVKGACEQEFFRKVALPQGSVVEDAEKVEPNPFVPIKAVRLLRPLHVPDTNTFIGFATVETSDLSPISQ